MSEEKVAPQKIRWGLVHRRKMIVPTWRGWVLLVVIIAACGFLLFKKLYPFLAVNDSKPGGYLVVEGWAPDYASRQAIEEFKSRPYQKLFTTGGPLENGAPLSEYRTYAEMEAATLLKLGVSSNDLQAVPAPLVRQDRTYNSAVSLKKWLADHNMPRTNVNVLTVGPHARRSQLMFQKAFGKDTPVGIIAVIPFDYDNTDWWRSSQGFRGVMSEFFAYIYAKILFHPPKDQKAESTSSK